MVCELIEVRDTTIDRLLAAPPLIEALVLMDAEVPTKPSLLAGLLGGGKQSTSAPPQLELADDEGKRIDLDKAC